MWASFCEVPACSKVKMQHMVGRIGHTAGMEHCHASVCFAMHSARIDANMKLHLFQVPAPLPHSCTQMPPWHRPWLHQPQLLATLFTPPTPSYAHWSSSHDNLRRLQNPQGVTREDSPGPAPPSTATLYSYCTTGQFECYCDA